MQTTKLAFLVMIGLAMIDFSASRSLHAATTINITGLSFVSAKNSSLLALIPGKSGESMDGLATVYADKFSGRKTASGQRFCQNGLTAAHRSLPLGTKVLVTNIRNSKSVEVSINDRGPLDEDRLIDLSGAAAAKIGIKKTGSALVKMEVVDKDSSVF